MRYAINCVQTQSEDDKTVTYRGPCIMTGKEYEVTVPTSGIVRYCAGALIQDAFPELSANDREFLISGVSPHWSWNEELESEI